MSHQGCCSSQPAGDLAEVLTLDGAFDRSNAALVEFALGDAVDADKRQLVIDLRGVSFLDSTMLRVLLQGLGETVAMPVPFAREPWRDEPTYGPPGAAGALCGSRLSDTEPVTSGAS